MRERLSFKFWLTVLLPLLMVITVAFAIESADLSEFRQCSADTPPRRYSRLCRRSCTGKESIPILHRPHLLFCLRRFFLGLVLGPCYLMLNS